MLRKSRNEIKVYELNGSVVEIYCSYPPTISGGSYRGSASYRQVFLLSSSDMLWQVLSVCCLVESYIMRPCVCMCVCARACVYVSLLICI